MPCQPAGKAGVTEAKGVFMAKPAKSAKAQAAAGPVPTVALPPAVVSQTPMDILMGALAPLGPDRAVDVLRDLHHRHPLGQGRRLLLAARIALIRAGAAALPASALEQTAKVEEPALEPPPLPVRRAPVRPALTTTLSLDDAARMLMQTDDDPPTSPPLDAPAVFSPIAFAAEDGAGPPSNERPGEGSGEDAPPPARKTAKRRKAPAPSADPLAASMGALEALAAAEAADDDDLAIALMPRARPPIDLSAQMQALSEMSDSDMPPAPPLVAPQPPPLDPAALAMLDEVAPDPAPAPSAAKAKRTRKPATPPVDLAQAMAALRSEDGAPPPPTGDFAAQMAHLNALEAAAGPMAPPPARPDLSDRFAAMEAAFGGPPTRSAEAALPTGMADLAAQFAAMDTDAAPPATPHDGN